MSRELYAHIVEQRLLLKQELDACRKELAEARTDRQQMHNELDTERLAHRDTRQQLAATRADRDLAYGLVNELRKARDDRSVWRWLRDLLPRRGATQ